MKPLDHLGPSLWAGTANEPPDTVPLEGERRADVVIVGAGFTGLSCAIHLAEAGVDVVVLEAKGIGHGGSGRNMGQVNPGVWADPKVVEGLLGEATGRRFNEAFGGTYELVEGLVKRFDIRCDLMRTGNIYVGRSSKGVRAVEARHAQLSAYGFDVELLDEERTAAIVGNRRYRAAMLDKRAGNIHPLNYALGLAEGAISLGATIHTSSRVRRLAQTADGWRAETDRGAVTAERAVIATDAYSDDLWPGLKRSMVPIGTYATATVPLSDNLRKTILPQRTSTFEAAPISTYLHMVASNRIMISILGYPPLFKNSPFDRWPRLQLRRHFPQVGDIPFEFKWGGTIGLSDDHLPRLHEPAPGLTICCGFSGRGITSATLGGKIVAERIRGTMADEDCPLPVKPIRPIPLRLLRAASYELGIRAFRVLAWLP
ncbi:MAG: FAD-binding oxidoreductase [Rhodospirillaceae bacterium]|jgi:glycine/D-amino acid oxidase-like deaminating enzyme|nr:FAD-binding oxidoreductase [Rhodospirillaceae bacterium]MBT6116361.1 FAD-binding oxidoreductase [Rhodospirillaceae bacterium]